NAADKQTAQLPTSDANTNESQAANMRFQTIKLQLPMPVKAAVSLNAPAVQQATNQQAPAGFTVTDPKYPAEMYKDPDASHYTYWWAQSSD
ncbi:hypothetical protein, partial [Coprococcus eutactus]